MANLLIDPITDDLWTTGGLKVVTGVDACRQRIQNAFEMWLGEWFLDLREGVPMQQAVLVKRPDLGLIEEIFRTIILRDSEIDRVVDLNLDLNRVDRELTTTWVARHVSGQPISQDPLVIALPETGQEG